MLKENRNIDLDYTDRVVRQLVDETEIDFKNSRVNLPSANFSFPFYSFGSRGAYPENIISEPKSNFGKYVISNYGVDETEYKEIYAMYMGIIASRLQDHDENINHLHLHESTEDNFLDKIVEQLLDETQVFNDRGQLRANAPFIHMKWEDMEVVGHATGIVGGIGLAELIDSSLDTIYFITFINYCKQMYGLTEEECRYVWHKYRSDLYDTDFSHLYTPNIHLNESTEVNFLDKIVNQLVDETIIEDDEYEIPVAYPSWITDEGFGGEGVAVDILLDSDKNSVNFVEFRYYANNMYGLDEDEIDYVWDQYRSGVWDKEQNRINDYHRSLEDENLNESKKDLNSYIHTVVDKMVDGTHLKYKKTTNTIWVKLPFYIMLNNEGKNIEEVSSTYITSPTARVVAEIRKHLILIYGMDKWETDQAAIMYLSKMTEKINDYKREGLNESEYHDYQDPHNKSELTESVDLSYTDDKDFPFLNKLANHAMRETEISRNAVRFPFIDGYISNNNFHRYFDGTSYAQLPFEATLEMDGYLKQFGLTENEKEIWWDIYVVKVRDAVDERDLKIIDNYGELNESAGDNVLDRIAYSMYKESISTPDSFPFDSTSMSFDDYVKNMYGISDEEADYVYREFRYLKGWSELDPYLPDRLNEHAEPEDIYNKIANSIANESEIVISPAPYNKMFLKGPAWEQAQHIENVIDQLTGTIKKNAVPDRFVKHLKEIFNIEKKGYNTEIQTIWKLYRDKMIERIKIKQAQLRQINPKQEKFFDHILKTLVDETEVQTMKDWLPDDETYEQKVWVVPPFLNHGYELTHDDESVEWSDFSYFGYGYPRYMKDIYGLTDQEGLKLWAVYYKALEKKVDELIERDRIIYGDD